MNRLMMRLEGKCLRIVERDRFFGMVLRKMINIGIIGFFI